MANVYRFKTKPYAHQREASIRAVKLGSMAFLMEPGTGKTKAALDAVAMNVLLRRAERIAILAPLMVIDVWPGQIEEHFPLEALVEDSQWEWEINDQYPAVVPRAHFLMLNYEKISKRKKHRSKWVYPWIAELAKFHPDIVILDESHRCKRTSSNRAQALWRLSERMNFKVYLLTGTPNPKGYRDLFPQYRIMDSSIFGTNMGDFDEDYCVFGHGKNQWRVVRYRNKKRLLKKIKSRAYIKTKEECLDLPPVMPPQIIPVHLPDAARRAYLSMVDDLVAWIGEEEDQEVLTAKNVGARRVRLQQITGGFTTEGKQIHHAKVDAARETLTDLFEAGEAVVVYARFLAEVEALDKVVRKLGVPLRTITGAVKDRRARYLAWHDFFQGGEGPRAILFQVQTGSEGIDLFASANVLFYSLPQGWETLFQCVSRLDRIGQKRAISQRYLICPGTIDVSQFRTLRERRDMHAELMGNPRGFLLGE